MIIPTIFSFSRAGARACFVRRLALLVFATAAGRVFAQDTPVPAGPVVELPKFVVTDSRELPPPESWRYGEIQGFEILTNASDRRTRQLLRDFELFRQALGYVFPVPTGAAAPTSLILCGAGGKFDAFIPEGKTTVDSRLASLFLNNREQTAIVIDFQASVLDLSNGAGEDDAATGTDSTQISVDHNQQLYREYVHYLLGRNEPRPPAWLEEGMAQIIMAMKFDKENIYFGELADPNAVSAQAGLVAQLNGITAADDPDGAIPGAPAEDLDFNAALKNKALVPLQEMFTVTHDDPAAVNPLGNNRWAKQSYAFVHMCLYGQNGRFLKPFSQFLTRLSKEPPSEALFTDCFKMSYKKMLDELRGYINFTNYKRQEFHAKKGRGFAEPPPLELRDATQSEVGRIKGEAFMLAGHVDRARAEMTAPYIRGERDPRLLASLGIFQHATGDDERARKFLEVATSLKVVRPTAYLDLAQFRYADALAKPAAAEGRFSAAQSSAILGLLQTARQQPPPSAAVYELAADTWVHSAANPKKEDIGMLVEGVRLFPTHLRMLYQTALFCADAGMNDVATPLVDYALRVAPDAKTRATFEKLKASLPPGSAPAKK